MHFPMYNICVEQFTVNTSTNLESAYSISCLALCTLLGTKRWGWIVFASEVPINILNKVPIDIFMKLLTGKQHYTIYVLLIILSLSYSLQVSVSLTSRHSSKEKYMEADAEVYLPFQEKRLFCTINHITYQSWKPYTILQVQDHDIIFHKILQRSSTALATLIIPWINNLSKGFYNQFPHFFLKKFKLWLQLYLYEKAN